jgi:hypothetical protein
VSFRPAPSSLSKRGITTLSDNLQPGEQVSISRAFINVFRPELEARLLSGGKPCVNGRVSQSSSSK